MMKVSYELKQGYIDIWNEESEEWDRYIKVNKKSVVEEDREIKKINTLNNVGNCHSVVELRDNQQLNNHILKDKINEIIDKLNELGDKNDEE